jgi:hypothetical protein
MDFLVVSPPVCTPAEPPSGGFTLAAGLCGHGCDAGLLDLSLEMFYQVLGGEGGKVRSALSYLRTATDGYEPQRHRTAVGVVHSRLKGFGDAYPGWKLTLMDIHPPCRVHDPRAVARELSTGDSPFRSVFEGPLQRALEKHRPRKVVISLAYLSQLPATIDLCRYLEKRGFSPIVGGSLPRSLAQTGHGLTEFAEVLDTISTGDGSDLLGLPEGSILERLTWPRLLSEREYLSSRPIVPFPLSVGCHWRRCRFCPDRVAAHRALRQRVMAEFWESVDESVIGKRPVAHLIDSAVPPRQLAEFSEISKSFGLGFYGFARPTAELMAGGLLSRAAESLQLGVESGSRPLLDTFDKGIDPETGKRVLAESAANGIRTYVYLLFGLPGEKEEDRAGTLELARQCRTDIDFLNLSLFNLPRYCALADRAEELGIDVFDFPGDDTGIRLYSMFRMNGRSPRKEARRFLRHRFSKDPAVRDATRRTPRYLRAAHLALMKLAGRSGP